MNCAASERPLEMTACRTFETPMTTFCCICNKRLSWEIYATLGSTMAARPNRPPLVAVDANVLFDLADGLDDDVDAVSIRVQGCGHTGTNGDEISWSIHICHYWVLIIPVSKAVTLPRRRR